MSLWSEFRSNREVKSPWKPSDRWLLVAMGVVWGVALVGIISLIWGNI
jgi:hypothetical protein